MLEHVHSLNTDEDNCEECGGHLYEIRLYGRWRKVTAYIFRSWSGERRLDLNMYQGPVYYLGTTDEVERR